MRRIRVIASVDRRGVTATLGRLRTRRDIEFELVAGAARAAASAWRKRPALVIFQVTERDDSPVAGAGAFDAVKALRAEPSSASVPILLLVPFGRTELRVQGFAAGASDVCFLPAPSDPSGVRERAERAFEESLFHLGGIPLRRHLRRAAAIPVRVSLDKLQWRTATALNLSAGGVQLRWDGEDPAPAVGAVLQVEISPENGAAFALFASVQGGTRVGGATVTRLRFVGVDAAERERLERLVASLPVSQEAEPELTPLPDDELGVAGPPEPRPMLRYAIAAGALALVVVAAFAVRWASERPVAEPAVVPGSVAR